MTVHFSNYFFPCFETYRVCDVCRFFSLFPHSFNVIAPQLYVHMTQFPSVVSYFVVCVYQSVFKSHHIVHFSLMTRLSFVRALIETSNATICETNGEEQGIRAINRLLAFQCRHTNEMEKNNEIHEEIGMSLSSDLWCIHTFTHRTDNLARVTAFLLFPLLLTLDSNWKKKLLSAAECRKNTEKRNHNRILGHVFRYSEFVLTFPRSNQYANCECQMHHHQNSTENYHIFSTNQTSAMANEDRVQKSREKTANQLAPRTRSHTLNSMRISAARELDWWMYRFSRLDIIRLFVVRWIYGDI